MVAFRLGIPYQAPFGHRGAIHSLAFAALSGLALGLVAWAMNAQAVRLGVAATIVMASHGLLDTLTDGGLGVALAWPFSNARYFAPWRPIAVAPIGATLFATRGIHLMLHECVLFLPLFAIGLWPMAHTSARAAGLALGRSFQLLIVGLVGTAGLALVSSTLAGIGLLWIEEGANPWSQVQDMGVSSLVIWPILGLWFVGGELVGAILASGTAGYVGIMGTTACLLALWVTAQRRRGAFRHTVFSRRA